MEGGNAPTRSLADLPLQTDKHRRPTVLLDQFGGDDSHHPGMPMLGGKNNGPTAIDSAVGLNGGFRFGIDLGLDQLALAIH